MPRPDPLHNDPAAMRSQPLPDELTVQPIERFDATVHVPGSKSITNRALLLASLASGASTLTGVLHADDTAVMLSALETLGVRIDTGPAGGVYTVHGTGGVWPTPTADLHLGNAGTATRFLTAGLALGEGPYAVRGVPRMHERPIAQLVEPLRALGARVDYDGDDGCPPLTVRGPLAGGVVDMPATLSSQFISALLQVGPCVERGVTLRFEADVISRPYVEMTVALMRRFGASVDVSPGMRSIAVRPSGYRASDVAVEPDASNATYFLAMAAATGGRCTVPGLGRESLQGDVGFAHVLEQMGCTVGYDAGGVTVAGPPRGTLRGIDVDLNAMPDTAQTLAAIAAVAQGPTTMRGVANLRVKETDRIEAVRCELGRLGIRVDVADAGDTMTVHGAAPDTLTPATLDTYDDHRMAMSLAVLGVCSGRPGLVTLRDPGCVGKTFPDFFDRLASAAEASASAGASA